MSGKCAWLSAIRIKVIFIALQQTTGARLSLLLAQALPPTPPMQGRAGAPLISITANNYLMSYTINIINNLSPLVRKEVSSYRLMANPGPKFQQQSSRPCKLFLQLNTAYGPQVIKEC